MTEDPQRRATILIIDDDEQIGDLRTELLGKENECTVMRSAEDALALLETRSFNLVDQRHQYGRNQRTADHRLCYRGYARRRL